MSPQGQAIWELERPLDLNFTFHEWRHLSQQSLDDVSVVPPSSDLGVWDSRWDTSVAFLSKYKGIEPTAACLCGWGRVEIISGPQFLPMWGYCED